jgi:hypothetical protein
MNKVCHFFILNYFLIKFQYIINKNIILIFDDLNLIIKNIIIIKIKNIKKSLEYLKFFKIYLVRFRRKQNFWYLIYTLL